MKPSADPIESRERPEEIRAMFDAIAPTYDSLNHLMSFGFDRRWRRKAIGMLREKEEGVFLDIAAGSGDVSLGLLELRPRRIVEERAAAVDAERMKDRRFMGMFLLSH